MYSKYYFEREKKVTRCDKAKINKENIINIDDFNNSEDYIIKNTKDPISYEDYDYDFMENKNIITLQ